MRQEVFLKTKVAEARTNLINIIIAKEQGGNSVSIACAVAQLKAFDDLTTSHLQLYINCVIREMVLQNYINDVMALCTYMPQLDKNFAKYLSCLPAENQATPACTYTSPGKGSGWLWSNMGTVLGTNVAAPLQSVNLFGFFARTCTDVMIPHYNNNIPLIISKANAC